MIRRPRYWGEDPILSRFELPLREFYYPFGFPVAIATNSPHVLEAAQENWGTYGPVFDEEPLLVRIAVLPGGKACLTEPVLRSQRHLLVKTGPVNDVAVCDFKEGLAFSFVSEATAENHAYLHTHYIDGTAGWLLNARYLAPVHGACVESNGCGLLLCGDSEAGKSSLAYACAREGWTFITDDLTEVVRARKDNLVLGYPHRIRLRDSAVALFPELRGRPVTTRLNGELAIELATAAEKNIVTAPGARVDLILFLDRQPTGEPAFAPFPKDEALRWFEQVLVMGEEEIRRAQRDALRRLLDAEVLEFGYSNLGDAVSALNGLVAATKDRLVGDECR